MRSKQTRDVGRKMGLQGSGDKGHLGHHGVLKQHSPTKTKQQ